MMRAPLLRQHTTVMPLGEMPLGELGPGSPGGGVGGARPGDGGHSSTAAAPAGFAGFWRPTVLKPLRIQVLRSLNPPPRRLPPRIEQGADRFDHQLRGTAAGAHRVELAVRREPSNPDSSECFTRVVQEVSRSRYYVRDQLAGVHAIAPGKRKSKKKSSWRLETSIWAPRTKWCDSKAFYDSEDCMTRMLECDWKRAVAVQLGSFIKRNDKDGDDGDDMSEVEEVYEVIWTHRELVYMLFNYYASLGASDDVFGIGFNAYSQFTEDMQLVDKRSSSCQKKDFDQLFIAVDASNLTNKVSEPFGKKKLLNRREFLQVLVQIAVMRYIHSGEQDDVSTAVQALFVEVLSPRADPSVFTTPNATRQLLAYNEEVDGAIRRHEDALRLIYEQSCKLNGVNMESGLANKLVSYPNFLSFLQCFKLVDFDLSERDATLAFVWARMHYIDEQNARSRVKWMHLAFEDFLECLCRLSVLKAWPTDEELGQSEAPDAPRYLASLSEESPAGYERFLRERRSAWGKPSGVPPVHRCVEHLCHTIILACFGEGVVVPTPGSPYALSSAQVEKFLRCP